MNMSVGKVIGKVAIGVGVSMLTVYADYRMKGGPSIRKLYKTVKEERLRTEQENARALVKMPIYAEGTVR